MGGATSVLTPEDVEELRDPSISNCLVDEMLV